MANIEFHRALLDSYKRAKEECRYNATRFLAMVGQYGAEETAHMLLASKDGASGFTELYLEKRLDLSLECLVLRPRWRSLFSVQELEIARRRLREVKHDPSLCEGTG
jgi:hypothetical protein